MHRSNAGSDSSFDREPLTFSAVAGPATAIRRTSTFRSSGFPVSSDAEISNPIELNFAGP